MDGEIYCDILENYVIPFSTKVYGGAMKLHQYNAPTHTGNPVKTFIQEIGLTWVINDIYILLMEHIYFQS